jgi:anti-sigma factor RsiW
MLDSEQDRADGEWSEMGPHDEFLELGAVSTSGDLTEEERKRLRAHLDACPECRQAVEDFEAAVEIGAPLVSAKLAAIASEKSLPGERQLKRPAMGSRQRSERNVDGTSGTGKETRGFAFAQNGGHVRTAVNWNYMWMPFAACVVLMISLGIYSYRIGTNHEVEIPHSVANGDIRIEAFEQRISDAGHEREALKAQISERDTAIAGLRRRLDQQAVSFSELKSAQEALLKSTQADHAEQQQVTQDRADYVQKLDSAQALLRKVQAELDGVRQQRSDYEIKVASLEDQIKDFSVQLREREQTIGRQDELLAHDRDIRDLIGARDLYIAEVYDVARDGATQKPYGRVFYTKGKSLIFYAYDLNQEAGAQNASAFQAWGRRGPDKEQVVNLGMFYEDNASKKRWVLRFENARTLDQIDAVFVTVEPNGGSHKPSGEPLLFAYLKIDPNHP